MTYTHLTTNELVMIEAYFNMHQSVTVVAKTSNRSIQTIYNVYNFLKQGQSIHDYYQQYQKNKTRCGRRPICLPAEQDAYIRNKVAQGWTPDVIIGRAEFSISCSVRTLYRKFKTN